MSVDEAFTKVVGRAPSEDERQRLYRLRDALGLADDDAFWAIVMALEHYDSFFRQYPKQVADEAERTLVRAQAAFAAAAASEAAKAERLLAERVAETSVTIAQKLAERPVGLHRVTLVLGAVVAFGALCLQAGFGLASSARPFWAEPRADGPVLQRVLAAVLRAPAGWMLFALLVPGRRLRSSCWSRCRPEPLRWATGTATGRAHRRALRDRRPRLPGDARQGALVFAAPAAVVFTVTMASRASCQGGWSSD